MEWIEEVGTLGLQAEILSNFGINLLLLLTDARDFSIDLCYF